MDPILERLDRIEGMLLHVLNKAPSKFVTIKEAMPLTGCRSYYTQLRWFKRHGIHPAGRGKYDRLTITNKVASLSIFGEPAK